MPGLIAVGNLEYNGYVFDGTAKVRAVSTPVRDEADRTVVCTEIAIEVEFIVAPGGGDTSDNEMDDLRQRLSHDGQELIFSNKGFSKPLRVNGGGPVRDVRWGPKVQVLQWEPIGSAQACAVKWKLTTCIPACKGARHTGLMAHNYEATYAINERGATTRTLTGYIEIAQTRKGRNVPDSADQYRSAFAPNGIPGFKRTQAWAVDKSKSRVNFTITDKEIESPNAYPPGIVNITGEHRVSWAFGGAGRATGLLPRSTITMQIERARNVSGVMPWLIFCAVVNARRNQSKAVTGKQVLIESINISEQLFGYTSNFTCTYKHLAAIANLVKGAAMWTPLDTDWNSWRVSLKDSMFSQFGTAGLSTYGHEDAIVDLCGAPNHPLGTKAALPGSDSQFYPGLVNEYPDPRYSWLKYQAAIIPHYDSGTAQLVPIQSPGQDAANAMDAGSQGAFNWANNQQFPAIMQSGGASYRFAFCGMAERAGFEIPRPRIRQIGTQMAIELEGTYECHLKENALGVPIFAASWSIDYALANAPGDVSPAPRIDDVFKDKG